MFRYLSWSFLPRLPGLLMLCLPLSFPTSSVVIWDFFSMLLCHQEFRHLGSVWRAPQSYFVLVHFKCVRSVQGKSCYFWCKFVNHLGDAGLIPSLVRIVFFSYFPAICVMLGWKFPSISPISSSWQKGMWCVVFTYFFYVSILPKISNFDILRASLA